MDWVPVRTLPVLAVGDAVILGSDSHSGWPDHHIIWYQLLDGSHTGDVIYVAEHLKNLLPVGRTVRAGQQIAVAPGLPVHRDGLGRRLRLPSRLPLLPRGRAHELKQRD